MKTIIKQLAVAGTLMVSSQTAHAGWSLEWIDDFSGDGVNWQNWTAHIQANFNNEIQCYTDDETSQNKNLEVSDGTLKIIARRGDVQCEGLNGQNKSWTSGRLVTKDKREFLYGRLETRLRFSTLDGGTWPAFWALENRIAEDPIKGDNDTVHWPNPGAGEIDIWEWFSNDGGSYITNFFNTSGCGGEFRPTYPGGASDVLDFHTYAMEWTPNTVSFLMDDQVVHTVDIANCPQYKEPMYVLINVAIGGNLGGNVDPALNQATMEIDYVSHCTATTENDVQSCNESTPRATDSDGDGVSDNLDTCPQTAEGVEVDINGCEQTNTVESPEQAPVTPSELSEHVISIYSDAYSDIGGVDYNPDWGQSTQVSEVDIDGNMILLYQGLNYQGTGFENNPQDLTAMNYLHFDYWTSNSNQFNFYLISPGPQETGYAVSPIKNAWQSVDVPLEHFTDVDLTDVFQLKVDGSGTVFFDNIYFYSQQAETAPDEGPDDSELTCPDGFEPATVGDSCVETNIAPTLTLAAYQNGQQIQDIGSSTGEIVVEASVSDPNQNDQHTFQWNNTFSAGEAAEGSYSFNLEDLNAGMHTVSVSVTDSGSPALTASASMSFTVTAEASEPETSSSGGGSFNLLYLMFGLLITFSIRNKKGR